LVIPPLYLESIVFWVVGMKKIWVMNGTYYGPMTTLQCDHVSWVFNHEAIDTYHFGVFLVWQNEKVLMPIRTTRTRDMEPKCIYIYIYIYTYTNAQNSQLAINNTQWLETTFFNSLHGCHLIDHISNWMDFKLINWGWT
jgi:hypothetical protein